MEDSYIYQEPLYLLIIKLLPAQIQNNHKRVKEGQKYKQNLVPEATSPVYYPTPIHSIKRNCVSIRHPPQPMRDEYIY